MSDKKKIAILGGGPSGLAAAFHLTNEPGWEDKYDVTIYQLGWRLGGKCATGRGPGGRIEEHGIHLFGNFYSNTFHMVRDAYDVLYGPDGVPQTPEQKARADEPIRTMEEAFIPSDYGLVSEYWNGKWIKHDSYMPHNNELPWSEGWTPSVKSLVSEIVQILWSIVTGTELPGAGTGQDKASLHDRIDGMFHKRPKQSAESKAVQKSLKATVAPLKERVETMDDDSQPGLVGELVLHILDILRVVWDLVGGLIKKDNYLRWVWIQLDYYGTVLVGTLEDEVFTKGIDRIDHLDYRTWLRSHGGSDLMLNSPLPQLAINICFQYREGDSTRLPSMSAAAYLTFTLRAILAKGAATWFFAAGTGETIVTPMWRVLKERGVKVQFFTKVTDIQLTEDGKRVGKVLYEEQARTHKGKPYEPTYLFKGLNCWPAEPLYDQLADGDKLRGIDLESYWNGYHGEEKTLHLGEEFDEVVLAIAIGALPSIASDIIDAKPDTWGRMIDGVKTIPTQAFQLWFDKSIPEMGFDSTLYGTDRLVGANYNFPTTDFVDFSDLIPWEDWDDRDVPAPKGLLYFCGPMQDLTVTPPFTDTSYPKQAYDRVKWTAANYLRTFAGPNLPDATASAIDAQGLDFSLLHNFDPKVPDEGINRINQQYIRPNIDPSERYVTSLPGSARHRLRAWDSGVDNLVLCGDWTYTGINVGSFEGAVMGGMLASYAMIGSPTLEEIDAYTFLRPNETGAPPRLKDE